jgi:pre-rRNA-processing protein IPI3
LAHALTISQTPMELPITLYSPTSPEFLQDHAFFVHPPSTMATGTSLSLQSRVTSLEAEVSELRQQLGRAKGVNDVMWETVVQKVIPHANGKERKGVAESGEDEAEAELRKKRGRV